MNIFKKGYTIYKLGSLLKDWKTKYLPSEYDRVIKEMIMD